MSKDNTNYFIVAVVAMVAIVGLVVLYMYVNEPSAGYAEEGAIAGKGYAGQDVALAESAQQLGDISKAKTIDYDHAPENEFDIYVAGEYDRCKSGIVCNTDCGVNGCIVEGPASSEYCDYEFYVCSSGCVDTPHGAYCKKPYESAVKGIPQRQYDFDLSKSGDKSAIEGLSISKEQTMRYDESIKDKFVKGQDEALCVDFDNDGFTNCDGDCDNNNADIYPGRRESCDNLDNDCNGLVDDNPDYDNDGNIAEACGGDDCDDSNHAIDPTKSESCYDGIDNNCDGIIDCPDCFDSDMFFEENVPGYATYEGVTYNDVCIETTCTDDSDPYNPSTYPCARVTDYWCQEDGLHSEDRVCQGASTCIQQNGMGACV